MYSFKNASRVAKAGTHDILRWMKQRKETVKVQNVEQDPAYQQHDVDLIWVTRCNIHLVEIKVDRYSWTGNFFLETKSNLEKDTPGCFLYTKANLIFYYFLPVKMLYVLPMPAMRDWFLGHEEMFIERSTTTSLANGNRYTTVGRLVAIAQVEQAVPGVRKIQLKGK